MRQLVVWGDSTGRSRRIVAAISKKSAAAALEVSMYYFNQYVTDTGNKEEIELATAEPGVVFESPYDHKDPDYGKWRKAKT